MPSQEQLDWTQAFTGVPVGSSQAADLGPMRPDCAIVRGKVPGPANHVMCGPHGHILDQGSGRIIAADLADYQARYGGGRQGSGGLGNGGAVGGGQADGGPGGGGPGGGGPGGGGEGDGGPAGGRQGDGGLAGVGLGPGGPAFAAPDPATVPAFGAAPPGGPTGEPSGDPPGDPSGPAPAGDPDPGTFTDAVIGAGGSSGPDGQQIDVPLATACQRAVAMMSNLAQQTGVLDQMMVSLLDARFANEITVAHNDDAALIHAASLLARSPAGALGRALPQDRGQVAAALQEAQSGIATFQASGNFAALFAVVQQTIDNGGDRGAADGGSDGANEGDGGSGFAGGSDGGAASGSGESGDGADLGSASGSSGSGLGWAGGSSDTGPAAPGGGGVGLLRGALGGLRVTYRTVSVLAGQTAEALGQAAALASAPPGSSLG